MLKFSKDAVRCCGMLKRCSEILWDSLRFLGMLWGCSGDAWDYHRMFENL